jgi:hypothetical protein
MIRIAGRYYQQMRSNMRCWPMAYVVIAVELRMEGLGHVKPSQCRPTEELLRRLIHRAAAVNDWITIIGNPANGPLASGDPVSLDDAAEWAASRWPAKSIQYGRR